MNNVNSPENKHLIFLSILLVLVACIIYCFKNYSENKLFEKGTQTVQGKFVSIPTSKGSYDRAIVSYSVDGNQYEVQVFDRPKKAKVGDSLLLEYAILDPSIARLVSW